MYRAKYGKMQTFPELVTGQTQNLAIRYETQLQITILEPEINHFPVHCHGCPFFLFCANTAWSGACRRQTDADAAERRRRQCEASFGRRQSRTFADGTESRRFCVGVFESYDGDIGVLKMTGRTRVLLECLVLAAMGKLNIESVWIKQRRRRQ